MKLAEKIIRFFFRDENETKLGDFIEIYTVRKESEGKLKAFFWLWFQVFSSIPKLLDNKIYWEGTMLISYFKVAMRNLIRNKLYSFINLSGLSVGISCCLLIMLWCLHELSYDQFHTNVDRSYRVYEKVSYPTAPDFFHTSTPNPLVPALKERFPEVEFATRIQESFPIPVSYKEKKINQSGIRFVDNDFFYIYDYPLIYGDKSKLLTDPFSVVLTKKAAEKYFGDENPTGKVIRFNNEHDLMVTGVLENLPDNTYLDFEMLLHFNGVKLFFNRKLDSWINNSSGTTITLKEGTDSQVFGEKIYSLISEYSDVQNIKLLLQPLGDTYLYTLTGEQGKITYVYIFGLIGIFVLLIACINFMNLSTAKSVQRSKEIGLRKAVGVRKGQLIWQFLGESVFSAFLAALIGYVISCLLIPVFNNITGKHFELGVLLQPEIFLFLFVIIIVTGLVSGIYPALYLSSFDPKMILSGTFNVGKKSSKFRQILTVAQFAISIVLIIATLVISNQIDYVRQINLGYDKDHLLCIELSGDSGKKYEALRNELIKNKDIVNITRSNRQMRSTSNSTSAFRWEGKDPSEKIRMNFAFVDHHFFETMKIDIIEGKGFTEKYQDLTEENVEYILNEEAVKRTGLTDPVGKTFNLGGGYKGTIKGVVRDFHFSSLKNKIRPIVIVQNVSETYYLFVRFNTRDIENLLGEINLAWSKVNPDIPLDYSFMDTILDKLYKSEVQSKKIFNNFSVLAIFIACLGLIGMASYIVERKNKEISIRKVLGASVKNIMLKQIKDFLKLIICANLIAIPVAYFLMEKWLTNFAYRTNLGIDLFLTAAVATIIIAVFTVSFQLLKASMKNPVEMLRTE